MKNPDKDRKQTLARVKKKIVAAIDRTEVVEEITKLVNSYAKLEAIEMKMDEGEFGAAFGGDNDE
jgi:hypothetical protein